MARPFGSMSSIRSRTISSCASLRKDDNSHRGRYQLAATQGAPQRRVSGAVAMLGGHQLRPVSTASTSDLHDGAPAPDAFLAEQHTELTIDQANRKWLKGDFDEAEEELEAAGKQAELLYGLGIETSRIYSQLVYFLFVRARVEKALEPARKAYLASMAIDKPYAALQAVRYGSLVLAAGHPQEALTLLDTASPVLENALEEAEEYRMLPEEEREERRLQVLSRAVPMWQLGQAEGQYYRALAELALAWPTEAGAVEAAEAQLAGNIERLKGIAAEGDFVVAAALREHSRIMLKAVRARNEGAARQLHGQLMRLIEVAPEHMDQVGDFLDAVQQGLLPL